ncbi:MAG: hypothetical protein EOP87_06920 [Verrucomicrobiaceae bacterium]|nr:MAG: hypothetical protein EOP87_06920 [Verrucomicrobiaceae bacterium]
MGIAAGILLSMAGGAFGKTWTDRYGRAFEAEFVEMEGEQLVLFTTRKDATAGAFQAWAKTHGVTELMVPKDVRPIEALPVLGTGKLDYVTMGEMVT